MSSPAISNERRKAEADAAYEVGVKAVTNILNGDVPYDENLFLHAFMTGNPYSARAWGDQGHQRPAWERGFNKALAEHYGVKIEYDPDHTSYAAAHYGRGLTSFEDAMRAAARMTKELGIPFWPEDRGNHVRPRFAVIRGFQIGEPVSYGFNGDSYVAGRIIGMSGAGSTVQGWRIITTRDYKGRVRKFWRYKLSGSWRYASTWSLIHGWHRDQNPEF